MLKSTHQKNEIRNFYREKNIFRRGVYSVCSLLALFLFFILYRLFDLQIIHHDLYTTASNSNILSQSPIAPKRGLIYDRNGQLLAGADPVYTLTLIPDHTKNLNEVINKIQQIITLTPHDLQSFYLDLQRHRKSDPVVLKYNVSENEADIIYAHRIDFPSLQITLGLKRVYPYHNATSHVVGYVGRITTSDQNVLNDPNYAASSFIGRTGVEKYFEDQLHGQSGITQSEVDASGQIIHQSITKPAVAGKNLTLSIDIRLQKAITDVMGDRSGSVVVVNPNNGEVLAMVSTPTFDPNDFVSGLTTDSFNTINANNHFPLINRAIHGDFSPGSTIKPFYSYYALYKGWLNIDDSIQDPGWFELPGTKHIFHDDLPGNYGWVNVTKAIILSSDTFFYNLANELGIMKLHEALTYFGFGKPTGIQLPDEGEGLVPDPDWKQAVIGTKWFAGDSINAGIGQGYVLMTPLQLAMGTAMIAERGIAHQATILKLDAAQNQAIEVKDKLFQQTPESIAAFNTVIDAMQGVIINPQGTGWQFGRNPPYSVAGKTGTVQLHGHCTSAKAEDDSSLPESLRCNQMFIAFAPVDHPQVALAVVIEHGASASHVARQVIDTYFSLYPNQSLPDTKLREVSGAL
jgi:penicillin-binding protein 2